METMGKGTGLLWNGDFGWLIDLKVRGEMVRVEGDGWVR
jgi:hypothetical protein